MRTARALAVGCDRARVLWILYQLGRGPTHWHQLLRPAGGGAGPNTYCSGVGFDWRQLLQRSWLLFEPGWRDTSARIHAMAATPASTQAGLIANNSCNGDDACYDAGHRWQLCGR